MPGVLNSSLSWMPAISAPRLNYSSKHETSHVSERTWDIFNLASFCIISLQFTETLSVANCGTANCNSFELPTQSFVRSWFPTWRTSLHNFACNALCAWALRLEDCTWQQIHTDNAHRCLPFSARLPGLFHVFSFSLIFSKKEGCPDVLSKEIACLVLL